jgi:hypothetical protein
MPWRRFAVAQDVPAYFEQVRTISNWTFDTLVGGHVARTGTRADVAMQLAFMEDLKAAAQTALKRTTPGEGLNPMDRPRWNRVCGSIDRPYGIGAGCFWRRSPHWTISAAG